MTVPPDESADLKRAFTTIDSLSPPCPDAAEIFAAVRGEFDAAATRRLVDHTSRCGVCGETWRLAHAFAEKDPSAAMPPNPAARHVPLAWLAAAAVVLLACTAGIVQWLRTSETRAPQYRQPTDAAIVAQPETGEVLRDSCRLRWSPVSTGARYTLRVATEDLATIARVTDLESPEYVVPASALAMLPAGARIVWQVDATLPDGRVVSSPTFVTTVR